jgi:hypothetical protein
MTTTDLAVPTSWRGVVLAKGEKVVKEYHASRSEIGGLQAFLMNLFAGPGTDGGDRYLAATTERLLFVGEAQLRGGSGRVVSEAHIARTIRSSPSPVRPATNTGLRSPRMAHQMLFGQTRRSAPARKMATVAIYRRALRLA